LDTVLQNPQNLTPLALLAVVVMQGAQLLKSGMESRSARGARHDDSLAAILQKVLDQHTESMTRQAASLERVAAAMEEVQRHMHATNTALGNLTHRLELVERHLGTEPATPVVPAPTVISRGRARAREA